MTLLKRDAYWTYDKETNAYYFAPTDHAKGPFLEQRHVEAIINVAQDGTLAGVELIFGELPPPPKSNSP